MPAWSWIIRCVCVLYCSRLSCVSWSGIVLVWYCKWRGLCHNWLLKAVKFVNARLVLDYPLCLCSVLFSFILCVLILYCSRLVLQAMRRLSLSTSVFMNSGLSCDVSSVCASYYDLNPHSLSPIIIIFFFSTRSSPYFTSIFGASSRNHLFTI